MVRYYNHNFKSNIFFFQFHSFSRFLFFFYYYYRTLVLQTLSNKTPAPPSSLSLFDVEPECDQQPSLVLPNPLVFLHLKCWRLWNLTAFWSTTQNHTSSFCTFLPLPTTRLPPNTRSFHLLQQSRSLYFKHWVTGRVGLVPGASKYTCS